jgi:quercetin dioxygenase-like cupin family protein
MINQTQQKNIFSAIRLRQFLNDIKRRPVDAAKDMGMSVNQFNRILEGKKKITISFVKKALTVWPIKISDFENPFFFSNKRFKIMKKSSSVKTSRIMKRGGFDYYEYRDTVMDRNAPFKPEWIKVLKYVDNNKPNNPNLRWNKGHLLHQFTYFVGEINFYYRENNKKKVIQMNTGDSVYISPYIPHTFSTRNQSLDSFIIAITFSDKINTEIQNELINLDFKNLVRSLFNKNKKKTKSITFRKYTSIKPELKNFSKKKITVKNLAKSTMVPNANFSEIILNNNSSSKIIHPYHQYIYILSDKGGIKIGDTVFKLEYGDTIYTKPYTDHQFLIKNSKYLIMKVEGNLNYLVRDQLYNMGKKNIKRIVYENAQWF